jgi:hypothetical protein
MQLPVHKSNLLPRGKQVGNFIIIVHTGDQVRGIIEVWKHFFGPWYYWQEIPVNEIQANHKQFVEAIRKSHNALHSYLPCGCSIGKAFTTLES